MKNEVKIVVGVGLAAGLTGCIYAFSKQELKVERGKESMFLGHDCDKQREEMEEAVRSTVLDNNVDSTYMKKYHDGSANFKIDDLVLREPTPSPELLPIEKEKINGMIQGMSEQEIRVVLQNIPVELMFDEIGARLAAHEQFAMTIQDALKCLPR